MRDRSGNRWGASLESPQIVGQIGRCVITPMRGLLKAFRADGFDVAGDPRNESSRVFRLLADYPHHYLRVAAALNRWVASEKLIKHGTQSIDIR